MRTNLVRLPSPSGIPQHSYPDGFINRKQGVERILLKRQHRAVKLGDTHECGVDDRLLQWSTVVNNVDLVRNSPGASTRKAVQGRSVPVQDFRLRALSRDRRSMANVGSCSGRPHRDGRERNEAWRGRWIFSRRGTLPPLISARSSSVSPCTRSTVPTGSSWPMSKG